MSGEVALRRRAGGAGARSSLVGWLSLLLATAALPAAPPELVEVPTVAGAGMEPTVRDQLAAGRAHLDRQLAVGTASAEAEARLASAFGELGQLYLVYDLAAPAEACLENARRLASEPFRWTYLLASLLHHEGRLEEAATRFEEALALRPGHLGSTLRLGEVRQRLGDLGAARAHFEAVLAGPEARSGEAAARFGLGRIALAEGRSTAALGHLRRALELQPAANALYDHISQAQRALGQSEAMQESLARRGEIAVRFADPIVQELQGQAPSASAFLLLGRMSMREGELEMAGVRFGEAIAADPTSAAAHASLAEVLERLGRTEEAVRVWGQALHLEPAHAGRRLHLAGVLLREGRDEEAASHLKTATRLSPDATLWGELVAALVRQGRRDEAAAELRRALDRLPREPAQLLPLAALAAELGENETARRGYGEALALNLPPALRAQLHFELGNLDAESDLDGALEAYRMAIETDPSHRDAHFNRATLLVRRRAFDEAWEHYRALLELDPGYPRAALAGAMALLLGGRHGEARQHLETVLSQPNEHVGAALLLAQILAAAPDPEVREGELALELSSQLFQARPNVEHGQVVAMALAEVGRHEEAAEWQQRLVLELEASQASAQELAEARRRLGEYEQGRPVRAPWLASATP